MKLEKWALITEIVSGVAVVTTLIFLILGVEENTNVVRASAYDRHLQSLNEWRRSIREDADSVRLFDRYFLQGVTDFSDLSSDDAARLTLMVQELWLIYENSYFSREYETLGEEEWSRFRRRACVSYQDDRQGWKERVEPFLSSEFAQYVSQNCGNEIR